MTNLCSYTCPNNSQISVRNPECSSGCGCLRDAEGHSISKQRRMSADEAQSIAQSTSGLVNKQHETRALTGFRQQCTSHVPRRRLRSVVMETIAEKVLTHSSWLYLSKHDRYSDRWSPSLTWSVHWGPGFDNWYSLKSFSCIGEVIPSSARKRTSRSSPGKSHCLTCLTHSSALKKTRHLKTLKPILHPTRLGQCRTLDMNRKCQTQSAQTVIRL